MAHRSNSVVVGIGCVCLTLLPGVLSADTLVLQGTGMPSPSTCLYFQGNGSNPHAVGDGWMCAGGGLIRLGAKANVTGASRYPADGDLPISVRSTVSPGQVRTYQVCYRNVAKFCTNTTINLSNGYRVVWQP